MKKLNKPDKAAVKSKSASFVTSLFCYALLILVSFIILFPFISKISASFMSVEDMYDRTVNFIPRKPTLDNYKFVMQAIKFASTGLRTLGLSLLCAVPQTFVAAMTGYALAKMKKKLGKIGMGMVLATVLVPPQVIMLPMYLKFRFYDVFGIVNLIAGKQINLLDTAGGVLPFIILSCTGMAFKNGIYIFLLRQFYKGIPEELEEAAFIDGCSTFKTFFKIVLPVSVPMMVTVFLLSFCWQWTDTFYTNLFLKSDAVLSTAIFSISGIQQQGGGNFYETVIINTAVILAILPLVILYLFGQRKLIAGIERSGVTG
ncbi:MAG TPA: carbohydrate ABC transporter permease [Ruminococcaceae bacterium]|nr:carbohydrate ABC transporter permease [Oscillospiraceae bacterium]